MIDYTIGNIQVIIPDTWDEVSFRQAMAWERFRLSGSDDATELLQIFTGVPAEAFRQAPAREVDLALGCMGFLLFATDFAGLPAPDALLIEGRERIPQRNMELWPFGATQDLSRAIRASQSDDELDNITGENTIALLELAPFAIALAIIANEGSYGSADVAALTELVYDLPCVDVYPLGSFFLLRRLQSLTSGAKTIAGNTTRKRNRQA
jgi:hypothetical protein